MFNSGFRSLSKLEFKCSVIQQRVTVVLNFMSFVALSRKERWCVNKHLYVQSFNVGCSAGLAYTRVYNSDYATLYAYSGWYSFIP